MRDNSIIFHCVYFLEPGDKVVVNCDCALSRRQSSLQPAKKQNEQANITEQKEACLNKYQHQP